jgi:hypothetical protein
VIRENLLKSSTRDVLLLSQTPQGSRGQRRLTRGEDVYAQFPEAIDGGGAVSVIVRS